MKIAGRIILGIAGLFILIATISIWMTWATWHSVSNRSAAKAMREHELFINESQSMTPEERKTNLRHQATSLTEALPSATPEERYSIQSRLVGIYGSLGETDSALATTKAQLEDPGITPQGEQVFGANLSELYLAKAIETPSGDGVAADACFEKYRAAKVKYIDTNLGTARLTRLSLLQQECTFNAARKRYREILSLIGPLDAIYEGATTSDGLPYRSGQYAILSAALSPEHDRVVVLFWNQAKKTAGVRDGGIDLVEIACGLLSGGQLPPDSGFEEEMIQLVEKNANNKNSPRLAVMVSEPLTERNELAKARRVLAPIVTAYESENGKSAVNAGYAALCYSHLFFVLESLHETKQAISVGQRYLALFPDAGNRKAVERSLYEITR